MQLIMNDYLIQTMIEQTRLIILSVFLYANDRNNINSLLHLDKFQQYRDCNLK